LREEESVGTRDDGIKFWINLWNIGRTRWHEEDVNRFICFFSKTENVKKISTTFNTKSLKLFITIDAIKQTWQNAMIGNTHK